jgi:hypothetical protein
MGAGRDEITEGDMRRDAGMDTDKAIAVAREARGSVRDELERFDELAAELHARLEALEVRLSPVLMPDHAMPSRGDERGIMDRPATCELGSAMHDTVTRFEAAMHRLGEITGRIDV